MVVWDCLGANHGWVNRHSTIWHNLRGNISFQWILIYCSWSYFGAICEELLICHTQLWWHLGVSTHYGYSGFSQKYIWIDKCYLILFESVFPDIAINLHLELKDTQIYEAYLNLNIIKHSIHYQESKIVIQKYIYEIFQKW